MTTATETREFLTKMYLAAFNRAPELGGLNYWSNEILVNGQSTLAVGGTIFSLPVVTTLYPVALTDSEFVGKIYENVFGKVGDAEGMAYWSAELAALRDANTSPNAFYEARGQLAINMINAGLGTPDGTPGKDFIVNRMEVATFTVDFQIANAVEIPPSDLVVNMLGVTADPLTVPAAEAEIVGMAATGETFMLTPAMDIIVGTEANDMVIGLVNGLSILGSTLNTGDQINGGLGNDTLQVTVAMQDMTGDVIMNMINVEKMEVSGFDYQGFNVQNMTGLDTVSLQGSTSGTDFYNGTYIVPNVEFHNTNEYFYQDAGVVSVIPMLNVLVDNSDAEVYQYSANADGRANYTNATITSIGAGYNVDVFAPGVRSNYLYLGESQGLDTVTVDGSTNIKLDIEHWYAPSGTAGSVKTVDAGSLAAALMMDVEFQGDAGAVKTVIGGTGADQLSDYSDDSALDISYTTGEGADFVDMIASGVSNIFNIDTGAADDFVVMGGNLLSSNLTLDMGAGVNTLSLYSAAALVPADITAMNFTAASISNVQILSFDAPSANWSGFNNENPILDLDGVGGLTTIEVAHHYDFYGDNGNSISLLNAPSALTMNFAEGVSFLDMDVANVQTLTMSGTDIHFFANATAGNTGSLSGDAMTALNFDVAGSVSNLVLDSEVDMLQTLDINAGSSATVTITAASAMTSIDVSEVAGSSAVVATSADFAGAVSISVGAGSADYSADTMGGMREAMKFVGDDIGTVVFNAFEGGVGANADRLDFSAYAGVNSFDDLVIVYNGVDTVITSAEFTGSITVTGVDISNDAANYIF